MDIVLGLQWGDEGKGKFIDLISENYDITARFNGGSNAGHSIERNGRRITLKMIPSGIFMNGVKNIIGTGTVIDPVSFKKEILNLQVFDKTIQPENSIIISQKAHLVMPTHKLLDIFMEESTRYTTIGSTKNGIAQAYSNKILRQNLRVGDIFLPDFQSRAQHILNRDYKMLEEEGMIVLPALEEISKEFFDAVEFLKKFSCTETEIYLNTALFEGKKVLAEGSQAAMLDIDHGTYPYVTSSSTTASGASSGLGVSPKKIGEIYGIAKAYCTRVGNGAFPTELLDEFGDDLRMKGNEFGSNTGRPRRTGWLDLPALKYAVMINGVTQLVLTKADVLSGLKSVAVCTHYELEDGKTVAISGLLPENGKPVLKWMNGWNADFSAMKSPSELPKEIMEFLSFLETELGIPVAYLSTGPGRNEMLKLI
ncbi:adenylosuccinate synthase [Chryseobacterium bernardetii]|uniref:Adenylosuccinate synthetase n=2 Tax=Chryseobacterium TaxID=59732 RepID=A0A543EP14_9FLAO|nr:MULTISPECIES: adenylosuccinate synthase [Chryseobacterium]MDR6369721.1 adenylosuccinate synthase [Chryseobacterium vietnamense]MDR6439357.1 adenylosuccinate synthase [Chryseobacterium bernardetii]TQM23327.1 adenylosuccinate synthetase [Chryseobacterium aquifrigidense]